MKQDSKHLHSTTTTDNRGWGSVLKSTYGQGNLNHQNISSIVNVKENTSFQFIGRAERIAIPEFGVKTIKVKIDTGAYTSAIHAIDVKVDGDILVFNINGTNVTTKDYTTVSVKSSNGDAELRYLIKTYIILGGKRYNIESTLSDRSKMKYPILIGRKFLSDNKFVVDVTSKYLLKKKRNGFI